MRQIFFPILLLISEQGISQNMYNRNDSYHSSDALVYHISAKQALQYFEADSIPIDVFIQQQPFQKLPHDSIRDYVPESGYYVMISAEGNMLSAELIMQPKYLFYTINNNHRTQIVILDSAGECISNAKVFADKRKAHFNKAANTFTIPQKKPEDVLIRVYTADDTCFFSLWGLEEMNKSILSQRLVNFKNTKLVKTIISIPSTVTKIFKSKNRIPTNGYLIFNQPKYKLTDTVKLKAFIVAQNAKPYKKSLDLFLEYYNYEGLKRQKLTEVLPDVAGSYQYSFPLSDTLENDIQYSLRFKRKNKTVFSGRFTTEDYLLDEIASYNAYTNNAFYHLHDSIKIFASAKNANGLSVLDGNIEVVLTANSIKKWYTDSIYIANTLFVEKQNFASSGENIFTIPTDILPKFEGDISVLVTFKNGNNEIQEKYLEIKWTGKHKWLNAYTKADSIYADYLVDGKPVPTKGLMIVHKEDNEKIQVSYPLRLKVDPFATGYMLYCMEDGKKTDSSNIFFNDQYRLYFSRIVQDDTIGFSLHNPYQLMVHYSVLDGNTVIAYGSSKNENIEWQQKSHAVKKIYRVRWQYIWHGEEEKGEENIAVLYKMLKVNIKAAEQVFPGQHDSVQIAIKDYKNRPVKGVNLSAVSYNKQFGNVVQLKDPPYLARYHNRHFILTDDYESSVIGLSKQYPIAKHLAWLNNLNLDTMQCYKMLFLADSVSDFAFPLSDLKTQISVHLVKEGLPQEIYLLYINNQAVFYNGVTDRMPFAFEVEPGYIKLGMRTFNQYIEIDSIYTQPFYKHQLVIDMDKLPAKAKKYTRNNYLEPYERSMLEHSLWQLDNSTKTNTSYVWQNEKVVFLSGNRKHISGPFSAYDSLHFFAPNRFDIHFRMEAGYEYNLSEKILRLEKKNIFGDAPIVLLPIIKKPYWQLGDTISNPPKIEYIPIPPSFTLLHDNSFDKFFSEASTTTTGKLEIRNISDSSWKYIVLIKSFLDTLSYYVKFGNEVSFTELEPGAYQLICITYHGNISEENILIAAGKKLYIQIDHQRYSTENNIITKIETEYKAYLKKIQSIVIELPEDNKTTSAPKKGNKIDSIRWGSESVQGFLKDHTGGLPILYATIMIKDYNIGVYTNDKGFFIIDNLKPGVYTIVASAIGYQQKETTIEVVAGKLNTLNIDLEKGRIQLEEVVVTTALGFQRTAKFYGYSTTRVSSKELSGFANLSNTLTGKVAGLAVSNDDEKHLVLRGIKSLEGNNNPLYVVDGILYDELPKFIKQDQITNTEIMNAEKAISLFGPRAMNGAIVISTMAKGKRSQFKDYAVWQPSLTTDENGHAGFAITYPDNITGWQLNVLAMDGKRHMGKGTFFTNAFKPVMAQLSVPSFLIEDDSSYLIGKTINYTDDDYQLEINYTINSIESVKDSLILKSKSSALKSLAAHAVGNKLSASFGLHTTTGFKDEEEREIPVFKKGIMETNGFFAIASKDTTINVTVSGQAEKVTFYVETKTVDFMLKALESLKKYPWFCIEQTTSKLSGMYMEQDIYKYLSIPFKETKTIALLKNKLLQSQNFDGSWGWWPGTNGNTIITNYVLQNLEPHREDAQIENALRNGLLYLQNNLPHNNKEILLQNLLTLAKANHLMDYTSWLNKLTFDSLNIYQQWQYISLKVMLKQDVKAHLDSVISKAHFTMTGGKYWGDKTYQWHNNEVATSLLAYTVLHDILGYENTCAAIRQYLLGIRQAAGWANTVETATILHTILPDFLKEQQSILKSPVISISGDTTFSIQTFPATINLSPKALNQIQIKKSGGGSAYLTLYEEKWNPVPKMHDDYFELTTSFLKEGQKLDTLLAGEKVELILSLEAKKDAEYVMVEVPIPAGCVYATKSKTYGLHTEYLKDRMVFFTDKLNTGKYTYSIELECRYTGSYTINPAVASLMYFPTFYGNNTLEKKRIK